MLSHTSLSNARSVVRWGRRKITDLRLAANVGPIDAFLVSYPKSGRTWLRYLLSCYLAALYEVPIEIDLETTFKVLPNFDLDPDRGLPAFAPNNGMNRFPLIAVSHRPYDRRFFADKPTIMLVRDPRDVCVSAYFHQTRHKQRFSGSLRDFISDPRFGIESIVDYHNGWAAGLIPGASLIVSYEELSEDTNATISRILSYLEIPLNEEFLEMAIQRASFDRMKQDEKNTRIPGHVYDPAEPDSSRVRKGKVGGFDAYLTAVDLAQISGFLRDGLSTEAASLIARSGYAA